MPYAVYLKTCTDRQDFQFPCPLWFKDVSIHSDRKWNLIQLNSNNTKTMYLLIEHGKGLDS